MIVNMNEKTELTKNFTLQELIHTDTDIKNNDIKSIIQSNLKLLCTKILQPARDKFNKPIHVNSGYRSEELNKKVGGSENSSHMYGNAVDITSEDNVELFSIVRVMNFDQLIVYYNDNDIVWLHVSYKGNLNRKELKKCIIHKDGKKEMIEM